METKELFETLWKLYKESDTTGARMPWNDSEYEIYKELREVVDELVQENKTLRAEMRKHKHLDGGVVIPL